MHLAHFPHSFPFVTRKSIYPVVSSFEGRGGQGQSSGKRISLSQPILHRFHQQRDTARSSLFSGYDQHTRPSSASASPASQPRRPSPYSPYPDAPANAFGAYPGAGNSGGLGGGAPNLAVGGEDYNGRSVSAGSFRSATPNTRGQYSDAVLSELESQNDEQVSVLSSKVSMLKDVSLCGCRPLFLSFFLFFFFYVSFPRGLC